MNTRDIRLKLSKVSDALLNVKTFSFIVPFLVMTIVFAFLEVYPFGTKTVLTVDLYHQYMPFIYELRAKLLEGRSLFYSWNSGLGTEFYAAFANYCSSPLNILCLLFPYKALPVFVAFVTALRAGLASLFMALFISSNDNRRYDFVTCAFGMTYALSGWFLTDFWNIMWCDAYVLLPLICLGLRRLFTEGKYGLYVSSLAICIISNFYAGYFICLFLSFFGIVLYFTVNKREDIGIISFLRSAGRFILASLTGGAISAAVVLPTYLILQHSSAVGDEFPTDFNLTGNLFDFLGRLLVSANPNIRDGMANVACGVVVVLMIPLFFMAGKATGITLRHKIGYGISLFVMYLSFSNRMLNFIWHGFHFPNQIPYRQSFIMSFLLVAMAAMTIRCLKSFDMRTIGAVIAGAVIFLVLYEKFGEGTEGYQQIGLTLLFLIIQGAVLHHIRVTGRDRGHTCEFLLLCTMLLEILVSSMFTVGRVCEHEGFTGYDFYGKNREVIKNYVVNSEGTSGHNTFERSELYPNNICEIQAVYDIKGMSIFSSTAREGLVKYMRNFGFHNNGINGLRNAGLSRVTATLLGVRNLISLEYTQTVPMIFETDTAIDDVTVRGNPDALSVGYMVSDDLLNFAPNNDLRDVFNKTNDWVRYMGVNADVYTPISMIPQSEENMQMQGIMANGCNYIVADSDNEASFTFLIDRATMGSDVYVYVDSSKGGRVELTNGGLNLNFEMRSYNIISLGLYTGEPITVKITYSAPPSGTIRIFPYELNRPGYETMLETLSDEQLEVTSYDDSSLSGVIDVQNDGFLLLTIPYSEGFRLTVDGEETELVSVQDALCGVHLTSGRHTIELRYVPEGFAVSLLLTAAGLVLFIGELAVTAFFTKCRQKRLETSVTVSSDKDAKSSAEPITPGSLCPAEALPPEEIPASNKADDTMGEGKTDE